MKVIDKPIPVLRPYGDSLELSYLKEVIDSGWWGKGKKVEEFEQKFAEMVGHKYAIGVTSNTHGQDLVVKALGLTGVDIINPTISFATTAVVPLWNNCTSNIVDVEKDTMSIDPLDVEKYKNVNSEMLIAVNHNGVPAKIDEIRKVFNGFILEDCAHSCYTEGAGLKGDVAVWSFQAVKTMSTGDGGMITTNDKQLADKCREMTWFGIPSTWSRTQGKNIGYSWDYEIESLGYKCYMSDLIAALGLAQMKRLPELLEKRRWIQKTYNEKLDKRIERPVWSETCQYYVVKVDSKIRNKLIIFLAEKNIHTSVHFKPLHLHPLLKQDRDYPISDVEWKKMITLPCYYSMSDEELEYVIYWVNKFMEQNEIIHT